MTTKSEAKNLNSPMFQSNMSYFTKCYEKNGKHIIEHYYNNQLDSYFETEVTFNFCVEKGYYADGELFAIQSYLFEEYGNRFYEIQKIWNEGGSIHKWEGENKER